MRKLLLLAALITLALGLAPAHAADPYCVIADANMGDDGTVGAQCTLTADGNPHGYLALLPNDWDIFLDVDGDGNFEPLAGDQVIGSFSPTGFDPPAGQLTLTTGANYTVRVYNGCAGACGHVGILAVK